MAKKLLIGLFSLMVLYVWWSYPLLGLRGGADRGRDLEAADARIEELQGLIRDFQEIALDSELMEQRIQQFEETLLWAGNPLHPSEIERDARSVCPLIKEQFEYAVQYITAFRCSVSQGLPLLADARVLPLTLAISGADPGDGERLVLAAEQHPTMRLLQMSVSFNNDIPEKAVEKDGRLLYDRETAVLSVEFYMKQEAPDDEWAKASMQAAQAYEEREIGLLRKHLIGKADSAGSG